MVSKSSKILRLVDDLEDEFYDFPYIGNSNPKGLSYFSEGLTPPTSRQLNQQKTSKKLIYIYTYIYIYIHIYIYTQKWGCVKRAVSH